MSDDGFENITTNQSTMRKVEMNKSMLGTSSFDRPFQNRMSRATNSYKGSSLKPPSNAGGDFADDFEVHDYSQDPGADDFIPPPEDVFDQNATPPYEDQESEKVYSDLALGDPIWKNSKS